MPEVESVAQLRQGVSTHLIFRRADRAEHLAPHASPQTNGVDQHFFPTQRTRIIAGRDFVADDVAGAIPVAIVDELAASRIWPGESPIGKELLIADTAGSWQVRLTVI